MWVFESHIMEGKLAMRSCEDKKRRGEVAVDRGQQCTCVPNGNWSELQLQMRVIFPQRLHQILYRVHINIWKVGRIFRNETGKR